MSMFKGFKMSFLHKRWSRSLQKGLHCTAVQKIFLELLLSFVKHRSWKQHGNKLRGEKEINFFEAMSPYVTFQTHTKLRRLKYLQKRRSFKTFIFPHKVQSKTRMDYWGKKACFFEGFPKRIWQFFYFFQFNLIEYFRR